MSEKRKVRPAEDRLAEVDQQIRRHELLLHNLRIKRERIVAEMSKATMKDVFIKATEAGMTPDEILQKLGLK